MRQAAGNLGGLHHVLGPEDGDSHWQPEPAGGYITVKVSPHNLNTHSLAAGFQVIDPGCHIRPHAHDRAEELLFIWEGQGVAAIDGVEYPIEPGSLVYVGKWVTHSIINRGTSQMKVLWVITPPGLEDFLTAIGPVRRAGERRPEGLRRPDNVEELLDRAYFVRLK
jgi:mannose-6-phosphate isomerase-like protein (cupin superfamily)